MHEQRIFILTRSAHKMHSDTLRYDYLRWHLCHLKDDIVNSNSILWSAKKT